MTLETAPAPGMAFEFGPIEERPTEGLEPFVFPRVPIPEPDPEDDARLHEDIRAHGIRTPLLILPDGRVFDGRSLLRHARALGLKTVLTRELLTAATELEVAIFTARTALARRHLTPVQKFALLHTLSELERERLEAGKRPRGRPRKGIATVSALLPQNPKGRRTADLAGRLLGTSPKTALKLQAIKARGTAALFEQVRRGELSVDAAYRALAPAPSANDETRLSRAVLEALEVDIPKHLWELTQGFKQWPRTDQEAFLAMLADFREELDAEIERRRTGHG